MNLDLMMDSLKNEIIKAVNESGLPPCVSKYVLKDVYEECDKMAQSILVSSKKELKENESE